MAHINDRPPLARLSTILRIVGNDPRFEERWANALHDAAFEMRTWDIAAIKIGAALNMAAAFETLVRARCKKAKRDWRWTTSQRKGLAKAIIIAPLNDYTFYYEARERSSRIIEATHKRVHERHHWPIIEIAAIDPRDTNMSWYAYSLSPNVKCSERDHLIVQYTILTCRNLLEGLFGRLD